MKMHGKHTIKFIYFLEKTTVVEKYDKEEIQFRVD